jgi:hypothetical protein
MKRRITMGRTRALIDWYVATRSVPVSPARSAAMSARAAGTLDELLADDSLQRRDLLADSGLRVAELERCTAEGARAGDGLERCEMPHLDAEPALVPDGGRLISISCSNGCHENLDLC